jgi:hypothetical protein
MNNSHFLVSFQRAIKSHSSIFIYKISKLDNYKILNLLQSYGIIQNYEQRGLYMIVYIRHSIKRD